MDRVQRQRMRFELPDTVIPHSIIALGYPAEDITASRESRYEENRVHFNQWYSLLISMLRFVVLAWMLSLAENAAHIVWLSLPVAEAGACAVAIWLTKMTYRKAM